MGSWLPASPTGGAPYPVTKSFLTRSTMYSSSSESNGQLNALTRDASVIGQARTLRVAVAGGCSGAPFVLKCTEVRDEVKLQLDHAKVDPPAAAPGVSSVARAAS